MSDMDIDLGDRFESFSSRLDDGFASLKMSEEERAELTTTEVVNLSLSQMKIAEAMEHAATNRSVKLAQPPTATQAAPATQPRRPAQQVPAPTADEGEEGEDLASMLGNLGLMSGLMSGHGIVGSVLLSVVGAGLGHMLGPWSRKVLDSAAAGERPDDKLVEKARTELMDHEHLGHMARAAESAHPASDVEMKPGDNAFEADHHQNANFTDVVTHLRDTGKITDEEHRDILAHTGPEDVKEFKDRAQNLRSQAAEFMGLDPNAVDNKALSRMHTFGSILRRVHEGEEIGGDEQQQGQKGQQQGKKQKKGDPFKGFSGDELGRGLMAQYGTKAKGSPEQMEARQQLFDFLDSEEMGRHAGAMTGNIHGSVVDHLKEKAGLRRKQRDEISPDHAKAVDDTFQEWIGRHTHESTADEDPESFTRRVANAEMDMGHEQAASLHRVSDAYQALHRAEGSGEATDQHRNDLYAAMHDALLHDVHPQHLPVAKYRQLEETTEPRHAQWNATGQQTEQGPAPFHEDDHRSTFQSGEYGTRLTSSMGHAVNADDIATAIQHGGTNYRKVLDDAMRLNLQSRQADPNTPEAERRINNAWLKGETYRDHGLLVKELQAKSPKNRTGIENQIVNFAASAAMGNQESKNLLRQALDQHAEETREKMKDSSFSPSDGEKLWAVGSHPIAPRLSEGQIAEVKEKRKGMAPQVMQDAEGKQIRMSGEQLIDHAIRDYHENFANPIGRPAGKQQAEIEAARRSHASSMRGAGLDPDAYDSPEHRHTELAKRDAQALGLKTEHFDLGRGLTSQKALDHVANLMHRAEQVGKGHVHVDPKVWNALSGEHRSTLGDAYAESDHQRGRHGPHIDLTKNPEGVAQIKQQAFGSAQPAVRPKPGAEALERLGRGVGRRAPVGPPTPAATPGMTPEQKATARQSIAGKPGVSSAPLIGGQRELLTHVPTGPGPQVQQPAQMTPAKQRAAQGFAVGGAPTRRTGEAMGGAPAPGTTAPGTTAPTKLAPAAPQTQPTQPTPQTQQTQPTSPAKVVEQATRQVPASAHIRAWEGHSPDMKRQVLEAAKQHTPHVDPAAHVGRSWREFPVVAQKAIKRVHHEMGVKLATVDDVLFNLGSSVGASFPTLIT